MKDGAEEFVILEHTGTSGVHWDLMLEDEGALLTWRLDVSPEEIGSEPVRAEQINNHSLRFLEYEGPVEKNTGIVRGVDKGACEWVLKEEAVLTFILGGQKMSNHYQLKRNGSGPIWLLSKSQA